MGNFNSSQNGSQVIYTTNDVDFCLKFDYEPPNCDCWLANKHTCNKGERKCIDIDNDICITNFDFIINDGKLTVGGIDIKETINGLHNTIIELKNRIKTLENKQNPA